MVTQKKTSIGNLFFYVGLRHLKTKPVRTILTTLGVSLGIALFVAIQMINRSTLRSFQESIEAVAGKAGLIVTAGESGFPEQKLEVVKKHPSVKHAVPMVETRAYFAGAGKSAETLVVMGVDLLKEQAVRTYKTTDEQIIDDPLTFLNQPDSIIVSHAFAKAHGFKLDSQFELASARGKMKFTVRGLLSPSGPAKAYGGAVAIMDIDGAQMTFGKESRLDRIDLVLREGALVDQVAREIASSLGEGYRVQRPQGQSDDMERLVKSFQRMLSFFSTMALLVGVFLINNSVSIAVAERKREIGTLRAVGATRKSILSLFLCEAGFMGFLGSLLGIGIGQVLARLLVSIVTRSMSAQFMTKIDVPKLVLPSELFWGGLALGSGASLVAAAWPAFRATRIHPVEAMRRQELTSDESRSSFTKLSPVLGAILLVFLAVSSVLKWETKVHWVEFLNQGSSVFGSALLGPAIVTVLIVAFRFFSKFMGGAVLRLSQDNLLRNPQRTGNNVMSLMVGLLLVSMISVVNHSFKTTLLRWYDKVFVADLLVSSYGQLITFDVQPLHESIRNDLNMIQSAYQEKGVRAWGLRFVHSTYEGQQIGIKAYDEPSLRSEFKGMDIRDRDPKEAGNELFHSQDPTVLVSENFELHFNKKRGDKIKLPTPSGLIEFRIAGQVIDFASQKGVLYMNRETYKKYWNDQLVSTYAMSAQEGVTPEDLRREIDQRLGQSKNITATLSGELRKQMEAAVDQGFAYTIAVEAAALLVALLGLLNTLLISVMERTRELGMLRAVGMSRSQLSRMIFQEAVIEGGLGAVVAVIFGAYVSYLWIKNSLAHVLGWIVGFYFPWKGILWTVVIGVGVAIIAGWYPARRAAKIDIREALEYE